MRVSCEWKRKCGDDVKAHRCEFSKQQAFSQCCVNPNPADNDYCRILMFH